MTNLTKTAVEYYSSIGWRRYELRLPLGLVPGSARMNEYNLLFPSDKTKIHSKVLVSKFMLAT
jgi:hypothetical protein